MATLISDTFTGAVNDLLTSHTPDINTPGNPWTDVLGGAWLRNTSMPGTYASSGAGTQAYEALIDSGTSDHRVSVDFYCPTPFASGQAQGLLVRGNLYNVGVIIQSNLFLIRRRSDNATMASIAYVHPGVTIRIQAICNGGTITATINGAYEISASGLTTTGQTVGIIGRNFQIGHDNFLVESLTSAAKGLPVLFHHWQQAH